MSVKLAKMVISTYIKINQNAILRF